ncbi:uncharacterized protein [Choristoneura fumiferana]|uniref:uncharacterized protein n=1 Tax=Choristoneura fumiferana TaxID=7141 RepID=UPI003D15A4CB
MSSTRCGGQEQHWQRWLPMLCCFWRKSNENEEEAHLLDEQQPIVQQPRDRLLLLQQRDEERRQLRETQLGLYRALGLEEPPRRQLSLEEVEASRARWAAAAAGARRTRCLRLAQYRAETGSLYAINHSALNQ